MRENRGTRRPGDKGFTIIELLVVVGVIALLSSFIIASVSTVQMKGRNARRAAMIDQMVKALEILHIDRSGYPLPNDGSWTCFGDHTGTSCPFGSSTYDESASFASALGTRISPVPVIRTGDLLSVGGLTYGFIISCKESNGTICAGYDLRYPLEGVEECAGTVISQSGAATFCQQLKCPGPVVFNAGTGVYDCG